MFCKPFALGVKSHILIKSGSANFYVGHKVQKNNLAEHVSNTFLSLQRVSYDINNRMIFCNYSISLQCIIVYPTKSRCKPFV